MTLHYNEHPDLVGRELGQELKNLPDFPLKTMTLFELLIFIHERKLSEMYPHLWTALIFCLTLPVTVAEAERIFSKQKLINSYLRSTMPQEHLSGLHVIISNHAIVGQISYEDVINDFASRKARKVRV
jgi:hypothetical protein